MPPVQQIGALPATPDLNMSDLSISSFDEDYETFPCRKSPGFLDWMTETAKRKADIGSRGDTQPQGNPKPKSLSSRRSEREPTAWPFLDHWNTGELFDTAPEVIASIEKSFEELIVHHPTQSMTPFRTSPPDLKMSPTDEMDSLSCYKEEKDDHFFDTDFAIPERKALTPLTKFEKLQDVGTAVVSNDSLERSRDTKTDAEEDAEFDELMQTLQNDFESESKIGVHLQSSVDFSIEENETCQRDRKNEMERLRLMRDFEEEFDLSDDTDDLASAESSTPMDGDTFQQLRDAFDTYTASRGKKVAFHEDINVRFFERSSLEKKRLFRRFRRNLRKVQPKHSSEASVDETKHSNIETAPSGSTGSNGVEGPISELLRVLQGTFNELEEVASIWTQGFKAWWDLDGLDAHISKLMCASSDQAMDEMDAPACNTKKLRDEKLAALSDLVSSTEPTNSDSTGPTTNEKVDSVAARWEGLISALERKSSPEKKHRRRGSVGTSRKRTVVDGAKRWAKSQKSVTSSPGISQVNTPSPYLVPRSIFVCSSEDKQSQLQQPVLHSMAGKQSSQSIREELDSIKEMARVKRMAQGFNNTSLHRRDSSSSSPVSVANFHF